MKFGVKSDKGLVRDINEDGYNIIAGYPAIPVCFIIADGMGGHNSGEIASKTAVEFISDYILKSPDILSVQDDILDGIVEIIEKANTEVNIKSKEDKNNHGMGTTLILAVISNRRVYIGHIGDSRAYLIRDGAITRITTDHSYIEELIKSGSLTRTQAENHPKKHVITRALGCMEQVEIDTYKCEIRDNDVFLLCTDGLTNMLGEEEIKDIIEHNLDDPELAANELVHMANCKGGEDNTTVIVFKNTNT